MRLLDLNMVVTGQLLFRLLTVFYLLINRRLTRYKLFLFIHLQCPPSQGLTMSTCSLWRMQMRCQAATLHVAFTV